MTKTRKPDHGPGGVDTDDDAAGPAPVNPAFARLRDGKQPGRARVPIILDGELRARLTEALDARTEAAAAVARSAADVRYQRALAEAEHEVAAIRAQAGDAVEWVTFVAIGRPEFLALQREHEATGEQRKEYRREAARAGFRGLELSLNPETWGPAIYAACCTSHPATYEQALELWASPAWNLSELAMFQQAAERANSAVTPGAVDPEA